MTREEWTQIAVAALPATLPFLSKAFRKAFVAAPKRAWHWFRERSLSRRLDRIETAIARVLHEVLPNNGGSMRDEMTHTFAKVMTVLSSSVDGQILFDIKGKLEWTNELMSRWTGRSELDLKGHAWIAAIVEADQAAFQNRFDNAVGKQIEFRYKCTMRGSLGDPFIAEWRMVPVREPRTHGVIGFSAEVRRVQPALRVEQDED